MPLANRQYSAPRPSNVKLNRKPSVGAHGMSKAAPPVDQLASDATKAVTAAATAVHAGARCDKAGTSARLVVLEDERSDHIATAHDPDHPLVPAASLDHGETAQFGCEHAVDRCRDGIAGCERHHAASHDVIDVLRPKLGQAGTQTCAVVAKDPQEVELGDDAEQDPRVVDHWEGVEIVRGEQRLELTHRRLRSNGLWPRRHDVLNQPWRDSSGHQNLCVSTTVSETTCGPRR